MNYPFAYVKQKFNGGMFMKNKTKGLIALVIAIIVIAGVGFYFQQQANSDLKSVTLQIVSKRDNVNKSEDYKTDKEFLGDLLKKENLVEYEDSQYGMYIHVVDGLKDDETNQYWWAILEDGQSSTYGADSLALKDGSTYTLELKQGY